MVQYFSIKTYQDLLNSDFLGMRSTKVLEVLIPPYTLIHFHEEMNDFSNVRVVILGNADLASDILVVGQTHLYTGRK